MIGQKSNATKNGAKENVTYFAGSSQAEQSL
jgi:hypothetical protein